jgi:hypothetical protein
VIGPDLDDDQVEDWPAVPFVRLGLDADAVRDITEEPDDDIARETASQHLLEARVLYADREAAALFGRPTLPADDAFGQVLRRVIRDGQRPDWLASLSDQVMRAAQWNFPTVRWGLLRSANPNDGTWYSPVLTHVCRYPDKSMQFDVHFQRFACAAGAAEIILPLPPEAEAQPAAG